MFFIFFFNVFNVFLCLFMCFRVELKCGRTVGARKGAFEAWLRGLEASRARWQAVPLGLVGLPDRSGWAKRPLQDLLGGFGSGKAL